MLGQLPSCLERKLRPQARRHSWRSAGLCFAGTFRPLVGVSSGLELPISRRQHGPDVIRQWQKRPHRNVRVATRPRRPTIGRHCEIRCGSEYRALPAVRQPDNDQLRPASRPAIADRKAAAIQGMMRVNDLDLSDSPIKFCGITTCSAIPHWPTPSSIASSTTPIASNSRAKVCASSGPRLDPRRLAMTSPKPT